MTNEEAKAFLKRTITVVGKDAAIEQSNEAFLKKYATVIGSKEAIEIVCHPSHIGPKGNEIWYWGEYYDMNKYITETLPDWECSYEGPNVLTNEFDGEKWIITFDDDVTQVGWLGDETSCPDFYNYRSKTIEKNLPCEVTKVEFGSALKEIHEGTFIGVLPLTEVSIPSSVISICISKNDEHEIVIPGGIDLGGLVPVPGDNGGGTPGKIDAGSGGSTPFNPGTGSGAIILPGEPEEPDEDGETLIPEMNPMMENCPNLDTINYFGTIEQWENITKSENWGEDQIYIIHGKDGDIKNEKLVTTLYFYDGTTKLIRSNYLTYDMLSNYVWDIERIDLPHGIEISEGTFGGCGNEIEVYYDGTKAEWEAIETKYDREYNHYMIYYMQDFSSSSMRDSQLEKVHCKDGDVQVAAIKTYWDGGGYRIHSKHIIDTDNYNIPTIPGASSVWNKSERSSVMSRVEIYGDPAEVINGTFNMLHEYDVYLYNIKLIKGQAFRQSDLQNLYCISSDVIELDDEYEFYGLSGFNIYVPAELVDAYKSAPYWSDYADYIFEMPEISNDDPNDLDDDGGGKLLPDDGGFVKP